MVGGKFDIDTTSAFVVVPVLALVQVVTLKQFLFGHFIMMEVLA